MISSSPESSLPSSFQFSVMIVIEYTLIALIRYVALIKG